MLIVCPKCFTKYLVSDDKVLPKGQKCHCSACGNYFEQQEVKIPENKKQVQKIKDEPKVEVLPEVVEKDDEKPFLIDETPPALFTEPLNSSDDEVDEKKVLDTVPEEFKPVEEKKSSLLGTLLWLCVAGGNCFAAYQQKDYLLNKIDTLIVKKLDSKPVVPEKSKKQEVEVEKIHQEVAPQPQKVVVPEVVVPEKVQVETVAPLVQENVVEEPINNKQALSVENISYEIGVNEVGMNRVLIRGFVVNTSLKETLLPETKAVLYDETDKVVARKRVVFDEKFVEGNSEVFFETTVVPAPQAVSKVEVVFDE